ncbi:hypothetical protein [Pseudosulfitobacter pseudonitzschiae]|uniref:hypothetical protein n=1 Tax=Pseudosulfitobacter pseudonitzschiae TaxID=1402135 RepID=UPI003B806575
MSQSPDTMELLSHLAGEASHLDSLSPEEFTQAVSETIPVLALEFSNISLSISRRCVPQFCADLRRGMLERVLSDARGDGYDTGELRGKIDPAAFDLPNRIEDMATRHTAVVLELPPDQARLLALDLAYGVANREPEIPTPG